MIRTTHIPCPLCDKLLLHSDDWNGVYYCSTNVLFDINDEITHYSMTVDKNRHIMIVKPYRIMSFNQENPPYTYIDIYNPKNNGRFFEKYNSAKGKFYNLLDTRNIETSFFIKPDKEHILLQKIKTILTFS